MAMRPRRHAALVALMLAGGVAFAQPTPEIFTYQGQLRDGGTLPTGQYDFEFRLFDDAVAGSPVGTPSVIFVDDLPVNLGLFNVPLDFGAGTFNGNVRYLEIAVRDGASAGPFTVLSPRVAVLPTPYAIYALRAGQATEALAVDWTNITNIPPDIADGDDLGPSYTAGDGLQLLGNQFSVVFTPPSPLNGTSIIVARADHRHDGSHIVSGIVGDAFIDPAIARDTEVAAAVATHAAIVGLGGHIPATGITDAHVAAAANIAWSKINVPPDILDGDDDTTYSAGAGLTLLGTTFSVDFAGSGTATTASRSDHTHSGNDIVSGTVGEAFIDAAIARDTEVTAAIATHAAVVGLGGHIPATGINSALVEDNSLTAADIANRTRAIYLTSYQFFARENGQNGTPNFATTTGGDQRVTLQELRDGLDTTLTTSFMLPYDLAAGSTLGDISFRLHIQHLNGGAGTRVNLGFFFERAAGPAIGSTSDPINFQYTIFNGAPVVSGDDRDPGPEIPATDSYMAINIPVDPADTWANDETTIVNPGDVIYFNIRRNGGAGTDTHSSSIYLIGVEVIYPADM